MELVFEEPPPRRQPSGRPRVWEDRAEALSQHPGQWVNATKTWGIKSGSTDRKRLGQLSVQMQTRMVDGTVNIFVRWVGEEEGEE